MSGQPFSSRTAISVVVANMVGTGVFTSLGFQVLEIQSTFVLLLLWVVGGITALCGALTYAELGASLPRSGGEYHFLGTLYHPAAGFVSGWVSATIGFAGPTALAAMTFGAYLEAAAPAIPARLSAASLVILLTLAHIRTRRTSGGVQRLFTATKVLVILAFCAVCLLAADNPQPLRLLPGTADAGVIFSGTFAVALIYVNYAYTGWNAATYLSSELDRPSESLPRVLAAGTLLVTVLYVLLNFTFLYVAPTQALAGKVEIGYVVARELFGPGASAAMGAVLALLLVSTVSAMIVAGPRVLQVIGEDFPLFRWLGARNTDGVPARAIVTLSALTLAFVLSGTFESVLVFSGFTLGLNTFFAVAAVFVLRRRQRPPVFRMPLYPLPPLLFLALMGWTLVHILMQRPQEALFGIAVVLTGLGLYLLARPSGRLKM